MKAKKNRTSASSSVLRITAALRSIIHLLPWCAASTIGAAPPPGRLLAAQCAQCHGTNGQAVSGFESISGKNAAEMYKELLEMSKRRPETIMDLQARIYTPEQLRLIANYLATLPAGSNEGIDD